MAGGRHYVTTICLFNGLMQTPFRCTGKKAQKAPPGHVQAIQAVRRPRCARAATSSTQQSGRTHGMRVRRHSSSSSARAQKAKEETNRRFDIDADHDRIGLRHRRPRCTSSQMPSFSSLYIKIYMAYAILGHTIRHTLLLPPVIHRCTRYFSASYRVR